MATRDVSVKVSADVTSFTTGMARAQASAKKFADDSRRNIDAATSHLQKNQQSYQAIGDSLTKVGLVGVAALAGTAKAALDWESAWAGVTKTTDGSAKQMAALESELRNMAKTLPATHAEIAAVAEAAGQLGVRREDISGFTKTMIDLGETTNLTADEAATSLAQFMNVMGTAGGDVDNLGAAIVELGNNGASTERDILEMAQRIAGAGNQVGLTETDVLAFSSALASVGINAEAGGSAISQSMFKIDGAVREAGGSLDVLAETSGMTSEEFAKAWEDDAAGALNSFIVGLGGVQKSGGDTNAILKELGITGIRETDALLRLAGAGDLLAESLDTSSRSFEENTALAKEAAKRYQTTESQIKIAWNNIKDAAIEAGGAILPVISDMADKIAALAGWFGDLPDGIQGFITKAGGMIAVGALLSGGLIKVALGAADVFSSFKDITAASPKAAGAIGKVAKAAGVAAAAFAAMQIIGAVARSLEDDYTIKTFEGLAVALTGVADGAGEIDKVFTRTDVHGKTHEMVGGVDDLDSAMRRLFDQTAAERISNFAEDAIGGLLGMDSQFEQVRKRAGEMDDALNSLATSGSADQAAATFAKIEENARKYGATTKELLALFPAYHTSLKKQAKALGENNLTAEEYVDWMGGKVPPAIQKAMEKQRQATGVTDQAKVSIEDLENAEQKLTDTKQKLRDEIDNLIDSFTVLNGGALDSERATIRFERAMDGLRKSVKANGASLDVHTEKGRANRESLIDAMEATNDKIVADFKATAATEGHEVALRQAEKQLKKNRDEFVKNAVDAGYNRREVEKLADEIFKTPKELKINTIAPKLAKLQNQIQKLKDKVEALEGDYKVKLGFEVLADGVAIDFRGGPGKKSLQGQETVFATGGPVWGAGGPTTDSIPAWLSNGEYVINARQTAKHRQLLEAINRDRLPRFRDGGMVTPDITIDSLIDPAAVRAMSSALTDTANHVASSAVEVIRSSMTFGGGAGAVAPVPGGYNAHSKSQYPWASLAADFPVGYGTPVHAWKSGRVSDVNHWNYSYGNHVRMNHYDGTKSLYAHLSRILADEGDLLTAGQILGRVGNTGNSFGAHLHLETMGGPYYTGAGGSAKAFGGFTAEQVRNARTIIGVARALGFGDRGAQIAIMTALQESTLRNLSWGDRDSVGLFQQRAPWGSFSQRTDPATAARMFFLGGMGGQPGLRDYNWQRLGMSQAAQAVQVSAFPSAYAKWADEARTLVGRFASGGYVSGPGGGRDDMINARLSNGEFVTNATSTKLFRPLLEAINKYQPGSFMRSAPRQPMVSGGGTTTLAPNFQVVVEIDGQQLEGRIVRVSQDQQRQTFVGARNARVG